MFERYTEKARRVIFFGRYEASQFGSPLIETEHLLLGILREDKALTNRFLRSHKTVEAIRKEIEANTTLREKLSTQVDIPLSDESKRVLAFAAEEAEKLGHKHIGTEHLVLGLLREKTSFAAKILDERGVKLDVVRKELASVRAEVVTQTRTDAVSSVEMFKDLNAAAGEGSLAAVVGRDLEIDCVVEVLCSRGRKNPLLIGPRGAGKTAIVEGLAQRISSGLVPEDLEGRRVLAIEPGLLTSWTTGRRRSDELTKLIGSGEGLDRIILFVEDLQGLLASPARSGSDEFGGMLEWALLEGGLQCIGTADAEDMDAIRRAAPWLSKCFREVHVRPLSADDVLRALQTHKTNLEEFHGVPYSDAALEAAARAPHSSLAEGWSAGKALELLDTAGVLVKLRHGPVVPEITEARRKLKQVSDSRDWAIQNHEFEKARFYSDEERKEKENLRILEEKHGGNAAAEVTAEDVEKVVARWSAYPYTK